MDLSHNSRYDPRGGVQVQALARRSDPLDADHARTLLRVLRRHSRSRYWEDFTANDRRHLMHLIVQGVLDDEGTAVQPSFETREALTQGRPRGHEHFPRDSRFHSDTSPRYSAHVSSQLGIPIDESC